MGDNMPEEIPADLRVAFVESFSEMARIVHANAKAKGFWDTDRNFGEMVALIHSEVSEALEAHRRGNPPDDKIPGYNGVTVELADVIIRVMDLSAAKNMHVGLAIIDKTLYNQGRKHKHGKSY